MPAARTGYAQQLYAIARWSSICWLRQIRARTLLIAGDDDPLVPAYQHPPDERLMPDVAVHIPSGGGHLWLLDHADESAVIEGILATGRRPGTGDFSNQSDVPIT